MEINFRKLNVYFFLLLYSLILTPFGISAGERERLLYGDEEGERCYTVSDVSHVWTLSNSDVKASGVKSFNKSGSDKILQFHSEFISPVRVIFPIVSNSSVCLSRPKVALFDGVAIIFPFHSFF